MRLPKLTKDRLNAEQLALYETILGGPRGAGKQHFPIVDQSGALTGPFGVMLQSPALGLPLQELGAAIRYRTGLSARIREIAILAVAAETKSVFEQYAHERIGRAVGLSECEIGALADGRFVSDDTVESAAHAFCLRLLDGRLRLSNDEYVKTREALGEAQILELVVLTGYYRTLAQLLDVFDVGLPDEGTEAA
ncbi:carboxymuconolactone decarboxylase family protein (plasmid) [Rhizobium leguminosarum]